MLRINLLPSYVAQRRLTRLVGVWFMAIFFFCIAVPFYLYLQASRDRTDMEAKATQAEAQQKITQGYVTDAAARRSQIAPLKAKVDFVNQVYAYNLSQVKFYQTIAQYTDPKIIYTDATVAGTVLTIKAFCPSLADVGRYLQAIYNEPDFQTVAIDKLPGYPEATVTRYYLYGKLVGVGSSPANTTPGAAGTPTSAPQAAPTAGGGITGATGKSAYGQPLISSALASAKDVPQNILDVLKSRISPFATPEQQARLYQEALTQLTSKTSPKGFDITVTATLKQAMTPPVVPGGAGGAAAPGGYPGGPPGRYPVGPPPGFVPPTGGPPPGGRNVR